MFSHTHTQKKKKTNTQNAASNKLSSDQEMHLDCNTLSSVLGLLHNKLTQKLPEMVETFNPYLVWNITFKFAVQYMKHFIYHFTSIPHGLIRTQKGPVPNIGGFIAQLVRASHRYREVTGSNLVESKS